MVGKNLKAGGRAGAGDPPPPAGTICPALASLAKKIGRYFFFALQWSSESCGLYEMSAFGGKADIIQGVEKSPLIAISGHCDEF